MKMRRSSYSADLVAMELVLLVLLVVAVRAWGLTLAWGLDSMLRSVRSPPQSAGSGSVI
jgi:hypothetical protein